MNWYDAKGDPAARLRQRKHALLRSLKIPPDALSGSLALTHSRCGKPNCRCAQGELHASTVLSYRGQGRPQNITPPPEKLGEVRKLTDDYRRFRQARTQLLRLQRQLLTLVDRIEAARVEQGERQFQELRSPKPRPRSRR